MPSSWPKRGFTTPCTPASLSKKILRRGRLRMTEPRGGMTEYKKTADAFSSAVFLKASESLFDFNDLFLVVGAACLADLVRYHQRTAFAALDQCRIAHLPVCSAAVSSCLRGLILGTNRHMIHLLRSLSRPRFESSPEIVLFDYSQSLPACQQFFSDFSDDFFGRTGAGFSAAFRDGQRPGNMIF